jgi:hypothetical protein
MGTETPDRDRTPPGSEATIDNEAAQTVAGGIIEDRFAHQQAEVT